MSVWQWSCCRCRPADCWSAYLHSLYICLHTVSPSFPASGSPTANLLPSLFYFTVCIALCSGHHTSTAFYFTILSVFFLFVSVYHSFLTPQSKSQLEKARFYFCFLISYLFSGVTSDLLALPLYVPPSTITCGLAISETKPLTQTDKTQPQSDL